MSYDVHIRVVHHPKHNDEDARVEETGFKMADPEDDPLLVVAGCLRQFADELEEKARAAKKSTDAVTARDEVRARWLERRGLSS